MHREDLTISGIDLGWRIIANALTDSGISPPGDLSHPFRMRPSLLAVPVLLLVAVLQVAFTQAPAPAA